MPAVHAVREAGYQIIDFTGEIGIDEERGAFADHSTTALVHLAGGVGHRPEQDFRLSGFSDENEKVRFVPKLVYRRENDIVDRARVEKRDEGAKPQVGGRFLEDFQFDSQQPAVGAARRIAHHAEEYLADAVFFLPGDIERLARLLRLFDHLAETQLFAQFLDSLRPVE